MRQVGYSNLSHFLDVKKIVELKKKNEGAKLIAHPECQPELLEYADYIGSTKQLITYAKNDSCNTFIVATEKGVLHQMKKDSPNKEFIQEEQLRIAEELLEKVAIIGRTHGISYEQMANILKLFFEE